MHSRVPHGKHQSCRQVAGGALPISAGRALTGVTGMPISHDGYFAGWSCIQGLRPGCYQQLAPLQCVLASSLQLGKERYAFGVG